MTYFVLLEENWMQLLMVVFLEYLLSQPSIKATKGSLYSVVLVVQKYTQVGFFVIVCIFIIVCNSL